MIVLDTHAWIWWASDPGHLSLPARQAIDESVESGEILVSSISAWEVALLVHKGRLELTLSVRDWIARSERLPFVTFVTVDNAIGIKSVALPGQFHDDPADRIIVATAIVSAAPLVTRDERILGYPHVETIW